MAEVIFTEGFMDDVRFVCREDKLDEILDRIALLKDSPELGSTLLPRSVRYRFGSHVRKLVVSPFDVIYEYLPQDDVVVVLALIHQRAAQ